MVEGRPLMRSSHRAADVGGAAEGTISVLRRSSAPTGTDRDSAERIRRREVSRALEKMDLSLAEEEAIEQMSRSLVSVLLRGPIPRAMSRAEIETSSFGRGGPES